MQMAALLVMMSSMFQQMVPLAIAGLGQGELLLILVTVIMLVFRIAIPIAVIFLLYQWWKNKKNQS